MKNSKRKNTSCFLFGIITFLGLVGLVIGWFWLTNSPQPSPLEKTLFRGVIYERDIRTQPRPMVIHILTIDLKEQGIKFLVTPGDPEADLPLSARTTSKFLNSFNLQIAVNGDGFTPWHSNTIIDYYPHKGDPIDVIGFASSKGVVYSEDTDNEPTLFISPTNQARINTQIGKIYNAISGNLQIVKNGRVIPGLSQVPEPRTVIALDRANRHLIIIVVDGRQPGYSDGATLKELAQIVIEKRGYNAINMDGGGSTTLVMEDKLGIPKLLNRPINQRIPNNQRPVGNHLGIYAKSLND
ncbi:MAG TPA: phosphodiester glycosidase family protein [Anaerolineae bacterium]|nr:phosphodiester glycosidase family protein [Anaerolineae bacterium]